MYKNILSKDQVDYGFQLQALTFDERVGNQIWKLLVSF